MKTQLIFIFEKIPTKSLSPNHFGHSLLHPNIRGAVMLLLRDLAHTYPSPYITQYPPPKKKCDLVSHYADFMQNSLTQSFQTTYPLQLSDNVGVPLSLKPQSTKKQTKKKKNTAPILMTPHTPPNPPQNKS